MVTFASRIQNAARALFARQTEQIVPPRADRPRYYAHTPRHPSQGLTPANLRTLLARAEQGDMEAQCELVSDLFDKDATLAGLYQTRAYAVLAKNWDIEILEGATESTAKRQAKRIKRALENISLGSGLQSLPGAPEYLTFPELREYLLSATPYGYAVALTEWDKDSWEIKAARAVEQKHFIFGDPSKSGTAEYNPYELRMRTEEEPSYGITLEPYQSVVHYYKAKPLLPSRFSHARTLFYWWMFKAAAVRSMLAYAERYGEPLAIGYYDPERDEDRAIVEEAVRNLGSDAAVVIAKATGDSSDRFSLLEPSGASVDVHERLIALVNDEFAKCILGHSSAAEATPGKLGEQTDSIEAQNYRIERDAISLDSTITEQIMRPMAEAVEGELLCYFKTQYERQENQNEVAKRYQTLGTIPGFRLPSAHLYETFNIPEPADDEETVGTPALTDPAAILATQAARQGAQVASNDRCTCGADHEKEGDRLREIHANAKPSKKPPIDPALVAKNADARRAKAGAARAELDALYPKLEKRLAPVYARLLDEVKPDADAKLVEGRIRENLARFRTEIEPVIRTALIGAGNSALRAFGLGDVKENAYRPIGDVYANVSPPFDLTDDMAVEFLDWQAFTLTVIEGEQITAELAERISDGVKKGAAEGITQREFLKSILNDAGVSTTSGRHMETVFRTNLATAHNASKLFGMAKHASEFPAWQFMAVDDADTTDYCRPLNNKYFPNTDRQNFPPLHFNCRSVGVPVGRDEYEAEGYELSDADAAGQQGFENTAVRDFTKWVSEKRSENKDIDTLISQKEKSK